MTATTTVIGFFALNLDSILCSSLSKMINIVKLQIENRVAVYQNNVKLLLKTEQCAISHAFNTIATNGIKAAALCHAAAFLEAIRCPC
ncbi:MAG: hypothetical protein IJP17_06900, partial [Clostridia bacterium]|nr:hypothetical protein [Clostridia bacterium]